MNGSIKKRNKNRFKRRTVPLEKRNKSIHKTIKNISPRFCIFMQKRGLFRMVFSKGPNDKMKVP